MYSFDENSLTRDLAKLSPFGRATFAAAAAARQIGNYEWYASTYRSDAVRIPREILDKLWNAIMSGVFEADTWESHLDDIMELLPEDRADDWSIRHPFADDALCSIAYAIRSLLTPEDEREAAWAARCAYEAADQAAIRFLNIQPGGRAEAIIKAHPLVQRELARQARDLRHLLENQSLDTISVIKKEAYSNSLLNDSEIDFLINSDD